MEYNFQKSTILIAEDDPLSLEYLVLILKEHFFNVIFAKDGDEAFTKYMTNKVDIILTDIKMPIQNGIDFIEKIRAQDTMIPIVYMSAYAEVDVLLKTMKHSANGFLVKPIQLGELFNCLNDGINKTRQLGLFKDSSKLNKEFFIFGGACINLEQQTVILNNNEIFLSKKEFQLLELLLINKDSVISKEIIEEYLWYGTQISSGSVKTLINKVRDRIGKEAILTVKNIGYKINLLT